MDGLYWKTLLKWMIWGYHYFRKHPYHTYFLHLPNLPNLPPPPAEWVENRIAVIDLPSVGSAVLGSHHDLAARCWVFMERKPLKRAGPEPWPKIWPYKWGNWGCNTTYLLKKNMLYLLGAHLGGTATDHASFCGRDFLKAAGAPPSQVDALHSM